MTTTPDTPRDEAGGLNDIANLANFVDGVDPKRYFDRQAEDAWRDAAKRWPVLAALLALDARAERNR
ncbi:hypothetical protein CY652_07335 [Burkholderia sp. WAC0059]|uniref:hypothetical protein n=1 Tax=Burkholderia sp. WAC0059 TaxID=2066022 RepID=UPI000C7EFEFB|nr:hypothetical protein [Burkholderia sp. WAC0059]PLZ03112.1 hypothetical protein CY652_07335 [Burkholderia sp. WAC0059]